MNAPTAVLALLTFSIAACGGSRRESPVELRTVENPVGARWNANIGTPAEMVGAVQVRGSGWMARSPDQKNQTRVEVSVSNAIPGGVHPWHVHRGQCGQDRGVLGPADAYKPLRVDRNGHASAVATLPIEMPTSGAYYINVHASPTNMGTTIACGNLAPPTR